VITLTKTERKAIVDRIRQELAKSAEVAKKRTDLSPTEQQTFRLGWLEYAAESLANDIEAGRFPKGEVKTK